MQIRRTPLLALTAIAAVAALSACQQKTPVSAATLCSPRL